MTAEEAETLFEAAMNDEHQRWPVDKPEVGRQMRMACWDVVLSAMRRDYALELERLRDENRQLRNLIVDINARDAHFSHDTALKVAG